MGTFSENLRRERNLGGYTQKQMAEKLNIPERTYRCYETSGVHGRYPDLDMVVRIADLLGVTTDELLKK